MIQDYVNFKKIAPWDPVFSPSFSILKLIVIQDFVRLLHKNDSSPAAKEIDLVFVKGAKATILDQKVVINIDICQKKFHEFTFTSYAEDLSDLGSNIFEERAQLTSTLIPTPKEFVAMKKVNEDNKNVITAANMQSKNSCHGWSVAM
jgi:hypothetical protein